AVRAEPGPALTAALTRYDRQRRPRVDAAVRLTRRLGALLGGRRPLLGGALRGGAYRRLLADTAAAAAAWRPPA
ncbi:MAG TPA: FAD-dependent monooxygenase, partial [Pilimelia sp.]|nr:FAD-dependent monooxygenase [Pilimelia sp.]